jgi:hypothetical protein
MKELTGYCPKLQEHCIYAVWDNDGFNCSYENKCMKE